MTVRPDAKEESRSAAWCFSTMGCPELSLAEACALAQEHRIPALELRSLGNTIKLPELFNETGLSKTRVAEICGEHAVHLAVAGSSYKLMSTNTAEREEFLRFAAWADALGIPYVRVFSGGNWGEPLTDAQVAQAAGSVEWWRGQRAANRWQIEMLLETHDAFSGSEPCLRLNERLSRPLSLIWDSHHTWRYAGEKPVESWQRIGHLVRHVHVKDSVDRPSARHPFTYVMPGSGQAPLAEIMQVLHAGKFAGHISLEWEKLWHPYLPPLGEALAELSRQTWFSLAQTIPSKRAARPLAGAAA